MLSATWAQKYATPHDVQSCCFRLGRQNNDWHSNCQTNCELWPRALRGILHQLSIVQWLGFGNAQCYRTFIELHEVGSIPDCVSKIDLTPCPWKLVFTDWHRWQLYLRNCATWSIRTQLHSPSERNSDQKYEGRGRGKSMEKWKEWDRNKQGGERNKIYDGNKNRAVRVENSR